MTYQSYRLFLNKRRFVNLSKIFCFEHSTDENQKSETMVCSWTIMKTPIDWLENLKKIYICIEKLHVLAILPGNRNIWLILHELRSVVIISHSYCILHEFSHEWKKKIRTSFIHLTFIVKHKVNISYKSILLSCYTPAFIRIWLKSSPKNEWAYC